MKLASWMVLKVAALSTILLVARIIAAMIAGFETSSDNLDDESGARGAQIVLILLFVCLLEVLAWTYPIRKSTWNGWRLVTVVFFVTFGVMTLQPQIEAIYFEVLDVSMSMKVMVMGLVTSMIFAPAAVLLLGRWSHVDEEERIDVGWSKFQLRDWVYFFTASGALYVILYMSFGHFVAWQNADVRSFYGGPEELGGLSDFGPFVIPTFGPLQFLRGLLWTAIGLPIIVMMRTQWWKAGLALGGVLALVMNAQLLIPNAVMPTQVRLMHFIETAPSNFIYGIGIAWLLHRFSLAAKRRWRGNDATMKSTAANG